MHLHRMFPLRLRISSRFQGWAFLYSPAALRWSAVAIVLLALFLRVSKAIDWNTYHPDSAARLGGDEPGYDWLARDLLNGVGLTWPGRVPLYPLWLAAIFFFNDSYVVVPYVQSLLSVAAVGLTIMLGWRLINPATGLLAGFAAAVSYPLIRHSVYLLSEVLYAPLMLLATLLLGLAIKRSSFSLVIWAGVFLGLTNLTRPALLFFPILAVPIFWLVLRNRRALALAATFALASALTVAPWVAHNYWRYGVIFPLQTSNAILWQGSPEYYNLIYKEGYSYLDVWNKVIYGPNWQENDPNTIEGDRYWTRRAINSIMAEPGTYAIFVAEKFVTYWVGDPAADWGGSYIFNYGALREIGFSHSGALQMMVGRALAPMALILALVARPDWRRMAAVYGVILYTTLLHGITHAEARLSEPFQPLLMVVIAASLVTLYQRFRSRKSADLTAGSVPRPT